MKKEILQAIIDNKSVQYKLISENNTGWHNFSEDYYEKPAVFTSLFNAWRIKPEVKQIQTKLALMRSTREVGLYTALAINSYSDATKLEETSTFFVKWLTDWITYKIEINTKIESDHHLIKYEN